MGGVVGRGGCGAGGGVGGLETPHCSRTGFDDEEGGGEESNGADTDGGGCGVNGSEAGSEHQITKTHILSPMNPNLLSVEDIDADNLAADFDGSFTGEYQYHQSYQYHLSFVPVPTVSRPSFVAD